MRFLFDAVRAIFRGLWWVVTFVVGLLVDLAQFVLSVTGRVIAAIIGLVLIAVGVLLSFTVVLAIIGIPLGIIGSFILIRAILP